jgi:[acyl-carrier-protein] S-malonyltransferase
MAAELWEDDLFETASKLLGWDLAGLCREGPAEELQRTEHAQPALFVASFDWWRRSSRHDPALLAGHSLGEYTALAAAGAIGFEDALSLVAERGLAMARASDARPGEMAALLGVSVEEAEALCETRESLWVANDNAPGQAVVAGSASDIDWICGQVRRARRLLVSGAFHTPFMAAAAEALAAAIDRVKVVDSRVRVVSNVDATPRCDAAGLAGALKAQLTTRVRFSESVRRMAKEGVDTFYCVGPGDAVAGMVRRIVPDADVTSL